MRTPPSALPDRLPASPVPWTATVLAMLLAAGARAQSAPSSDSELARQYARVAEWIGFWEAEETKSSSSQSTVNPAIRTRSREERWSSGKFRLRPRLPERGGTWDPEHGVFEWSGPGVERHTFSGISVDRDGPGRGHELGSSAAGSRDVQALRFRVQLSEGGRASVGMGYWDKQIVGRETGTIYYEDSSGGKTALTSRSVDRPFDSTTIAPLAHKTTKSGGSWPFRQAPGVITFEDSESNTGGTGERRSAYRFRGRVLLAPVYDGLEVAVTIEDYESWLPSGNLATPSQSGGSLTARAVLIVRGEAAKSPPRVKHFRFELSDVSHEPGVCMNWPLLGPKGDEPPAKDPLPDLRFSRIRGGQVGTDALSATFEPQDDANGRPSAAAQIDSYDFGGYATLRVHCVLEDERQILGILTQQGEGLALIPLPWRGSGSKIAKAWSDSVGLSGGDGSDSDAMPVGDGNVGDGFSNYEEYRGFAMYGAAYRTNPRRKDLFIQNRLGLKALQGIFRYAEITKLAVNHRVRAGEMPESRRMNANRSADSPHSCADDQFQHGLILDKIEAGTASITEASGDRWRPQFVSAVLILADLFDPERQENLASTIAHELLHATGVPHHGDGGDGPVIWLQKTGLVDGREESWFEERPTRWSEEVGDYIFPSTPGDHIRIFDWEGMEIPARVPFLKLPTVMYLGHHGLQHSGDVNCVMRYDCATAFVLPSRERDRFLSPGEPTGMGICSSAKGTEFNAPNQPNHKFVRYGDAKLGACVHRFCVRDDAPNRARLP